MKCEQTTLEAIRPNSTNNDFWERRAILAEERVTQLQRANAALSCELKSVQDDHYRFVEATKFEKRRMSETIVTLNEDLKAARGGEGGKTGEPRLSDRIYKDLRAELRSLRHQLTCARSKDIRQANEIKKLKQEKKTAWLTLASYAKLESSASQVKTNSDPVPSDPADTTIFELPTSTINDPSSSAS